MTDKNETDKNETIDTGAQRTGAQSNGTGGMSLQLSVDEANLLLEALGQMPFTRVYELIGKIQQQAQAQLAGAPAQHGPAVPPLEG